MVELKKRLDSDRDLVGTNVSLHPLAELSCIAAWCSCMCFCDKPSSLLLTEVCRMVAMTVFGTVVGTTSPWIGHRHMNFHFCCVARNVPIVPVAEDYVSPSPSHSYISSWKDGEAFILSKSKHRFVNSGCCSSGLAGTNSQITDQKCFVRFVADALLVIAVSRFCRWFLRLRVLSVNAPKSCCILFLAMLVGVSLRVIGCGPLLV